MQFLKKLQNSRPQAPGRTPGIEWSILKKLPAVLLAGTILPMLFSALSRVFPPDGPPTQVAETILRVDIVSIATAVTVWMTVLPIAIGCVVVVIMKGPAYVADGYPLTDSDKPSSQDTR